MNEEKNLGGRPAKYTDPEKMAAGVEAYFDGLKTGEGIPDRPPTMTGLAMALGFEDRQSLADYNVKDGFTCVIKRAKNLVKEYWESRLAGNNPTGAIFWLKNHDGCRDSLGLELPADGFKLTISHETEGL